MDYVVVFEFTVWEERGGIGEIRKGGILNLEYVSYVVSWGLGWDRGRDGVLEEGI